MRWKFWATHKGRAADTQPHKAEPASPRGPSSREWLYLPPLTPTVRPSAPLVVGAAPVRPPLLAEHRPVTTERAVVGRVEGLATVLPPPEPAVPGPPLPAPAPRRRARAVPSAAEPAPLTAATDAFVGEAREPAEPHRAPGWLRYVPEWLQPEAPVEIPSNIPTVLPPTSLIPPSRLAEPVAPTRPAESVSPTEAPVARRRPSLGQTRRLGLGAPVSAPDEPEPPPPARSDGPPRTGFPYTMDGLRRVDEPPAPSLADALAQAGLPLVHPTGDTPSPPERGEAAPTPAEPPPAPPRAADSVVRVDAPPDVAAEVGRASGVDVSAVPVFRGPAVDAAAHERGARAFARADAVFLPDAAGPLTTPKARALVAHELVHVAQQRSRGRTPAADSAEGRRMEAEAVAVERRYESTAVVGPELHHPPTPTPVPDMAGPAQLATYATAPPDPAQSRFDVPAREEIVQLAESSAHRVVEEWTHPALGRTPGRTPRDSTEDTFDRAGRRAELEHEMLETINADRVDQDLPQLSYLEPDDVERLERRLDREEATGVRTDRRSGRSGRTATPPLVGGAFGDTVSFTQTIGGPAPDPAETPATAQTRARSAPSARGRTAVDAASRLSLAAALTGQAEEDDERLPATEGGKFGDTVSFTERQGDDLFKGGQRPEPKQDNEAMHGSEEVPIDLDRVDLEELTARLYDRLRGRLRLELLVDRERAGLLTDFR